MFRNVESMRILVTGATGYVGSRLVAALLENGHDVVAATRDQEKLSRFGWCDQVSAVMLDADDVVYYLVHGIGQAGYRDRDNAGAATVATVAAVAAAAGVRRIVYLGGFVPDDQLVDPHHLADSDPVWAGGDALRLQQLASAVTPSVMRPALGLLGSVPRPLAGVLRTGLELFLSKVPGL
jgi:NAD(P)-dependent dehydrogenase (short-subunit alcohol dehydrogenase family)